MTNPGLAPWALKECRPCRAPCCPPLIPHQSFVVLIIGLVSLFVLVVGLVGWYRCLRLLSNWLGGVVVCVCCCVCWAVLLFVLVVGFVGCRCLRLSSDLLCGAGVSAVGTILLQSPGCNEGKARNATLGKHGHKK